MKKTSIKNLKVTKWALAFLLASSLSVPALTGCSGNANTSEENTQEIEQETDNQQKLALEQEAPYQAIIINGNDACIIYCKNYFGYSSNIGITTQNNEQILMMDGYILKSGQDPEEFIHSLIGKDAEIHYYGNAKSKKAKN